MRMLLLIMRPLKSYRDRDEAAVGHTLKFNLKVKATHTEMRTE